MHWLFSILTTLFLLPVLAGRLTPCAAGASETVCHDARGSLVFDEAGDLAIAANDDAVSRFAYDDGHRVISAETLVGSEVFATAWRYDADGLVTNVVYAPGKTLTKTYDTDGRLASVSDWLGHVWTFVHDGAGKPAGGTSPDGLALAYDAQGWLVSGCPGAVPIVPTVPDVPSDVLGTFAYDALGNRIRAGGHIFIPDHADPLKRPLLECAADGTVLRHYLWGNGRLLGSIDATNALTVAHSDEQGSVIALTTPDGTLLHMANYGPHGEDWGSVGTNATPFAWLGGYGVQRLAAAFAGATDDSSVDCRLGPLYLTRHRLYSATLHRFLSADPLGPAGGYNLYAYANGNPLAYIDPLGLCAGSGESGFFDYLGDSAEQVLLGNYTGAAFGSDPGGGVCGGV